MWAIIKIEGEQNNEADSAVLLKPNRDNKAQKKECYYADYSNLDKVLGGIHPEHLFIIIHQSHELWFKQLLVEFHSIIDVINMPENGFELAK